MEEEFKNILTNKIKKITINDESDIFKKHPSFKPLEYHDYFKELVIHDVEYLKLLENAQIDKSSILSIKFNKNFSPDLEFLNNFPNLEIIELLDTNLDLDLLYKLYENFPNLKQLEFLSVDDKVLEVMPSFNFKIMTKDKKHNIDLEHTIYQNPIFTEDTHFKIYGVLNKFELINRNSIYLNLPIDNKYLDELIEVCPNLTEIHLKTDNFIEIEKTASYLENKTNKISLYQVTLPTNKSYDGMVDLNFSLIADKLDIKIAGNVHSSSIKDFLNMRKAFDFFISQLNSHNLSTIEKIMYLYDITKSFQYNAEENNMDVFTSRAIESIFSTGYIVCVGYANILNQLLAGIGVNANRVSILSQQNHESLKNEDNIIAPLESNHARNIARIDDDKYDIHGVFSLDATWDSLVPGITELDSYRFFLTPPSEYQKIYPNDSYPPIYSEYWGLLEGRENTYNKYSEKAIRKFKESMLLDDNDIYNDYMESSALSVEQFREVVTNVRVAQGYEGELLEKEVEKAVSNYEINYIAKITQSQNVSRL